MKNLRISALIGLCCLFMFSCQQEEIATLEPQAEQKWLSFHSREDLKGFVENGKKEELESFQQKVKGLQAQNFTPLLTVSPETHNERVKFAEQKTEEYGKMMQTYQPGFIMNRSEAALADLDATEDPIIADPYFASVLNNEREILVDDTVYKFTEKGLFFTPKSNYNNLNSTVQRIEPCLMLHSEGVTYVGDNVQAYMPVPIDDGCGGGGGGCCTGGGGSGGGGSYTPPTKEEIRDNLKICEYRPNVLNKLFGPSEKCIDKFNDRERIKVKTWAQNYLIFASTGVKVKSQKRTLGVWWADKIDELELGYSIASFKYKGIIQFPTTGFSGPDFHYELNGYTIDQYGRYVSGPSPAKNLFTNFPLPDDQELVKIYVYKPIQDVIKAITGNTVTSLDYSGKDFNKMVRKLVKNAVNELKKKGKQLNKSPKAVVVFEEPFSKDLSFVYTNYRNTKTNENKISKVFDWNTAVIGVNIKGQNTTPVYTQPKKPEDFQIVCYGMGRRGTTWKGGRIILTQ